MNINNKDRTTICLVTAILWSALALYEIFQSIQLLSAAHYLTAFNLYLGISPVACFTMLALCFFLKKRIMGIIGAGLQCVQYGIVLLTYSIVFRYLMSTAPQLYYTVLLFTMVWVMILIAIIYTNKHSATLGVVASILYVAAIVISFDLDAYSEVAIYANIVFTAVFVLTGISSNHLSEIIQTADSKTTNNGISMLSGNNGIVKENTQIRKEQSWSTTVYGNGSSSTLGVPTDNMEKISTVIQDNMRDRINLQAGVEDIQNKDSLAFCPYCGVKQIVSGASFCYKCGKALPSLSDLNPKTSNTTNTNPDSVQNGNAEHKVYKPDSSKVKYVYNSYNSELRTSIFPGEINQAENIVFSLAQIYDIDLRKADISLYQEIMGSYVDMLIRHVVSGMSTERIIASLKQKHPNLISNDEIARNACAYMYLVVKDTGFCLSTDSDRDDLKAMSDVLLQNMEYRTINAKHLNDNLDDPEYGLVNTKPIYCDGVRGVEQYLSRLKTLSGESIKWKRDSVYSIDSIAGPVDAYSITYQSGELYTTVYINIYAPSTNFDKYPRVFTQ